MLHVDDMKRLYFDAVQHIDSVKGHAFNIGGGMPNSLSLLELFSLLEEMLDVQLKFTKLPPRESDQKIFVADLRKVSKQLEWIPSVSCKSGIKSVIDWLERM
ncbi:MAG: CDP-paratose 2-epimerase [Syntrophomonadaceae bacterium]|nr:CDP-paratose 2-epimerase [Bacillota bacterium]